MAETTTTGAALPVPVPPADATLAADAIAQSLVENGVDRLFLVTGSDLWLFRSLRDRGIPMHLARSEAGAVAMADAYARLTGRPSAVYAQWGPGAANVSAALADAWWARSPVLAITSTVSTRVEHRNEYQELDQPPLFESVTKWQARITRADRAGELVALALRHATAGCPGPVHLDMPTDVHNQPVDLAESYASPAPPIAPAPAPGAVAEIVDRLAAAERPLILAGNGVLLANAALELTRLAEGLGIPVTTSMGGKGAIDEDHRLAVGVVGRYSRRVANEIMGEADCVLALGTDLGGLVTDSYRLPPPSARLIQVDLVPERIGETLPVDLGVTADAGAAVRALLKVAPAPLSPAHAVWAADVAERVDGWSNDLAALIGRPADGHVRPEALVHVLRELTQPDDVLVADTGFMGAWGGVLFPARRPGRTFLRAAGTLGWAWPAVLGAQVALGRERRAIALVGDGGFGYNVGDLETAVRLKLPAIAIVLNNSTLAYEVAGFSHLFDGDVIDEVCDYVDLDHGAVARSFGAFGARADSLASFRAALAQALEQDRPAVIDVVVSRTRYAPVTSFDAWRRRDI